MLVLDEKIPGFKKQMLLLIKPFRKLLDKEVMEVLKLNCQTIEKLDNAIGKLEQK